jgi:hypothetical protein
MYFSVHFTKQLTDFWIALYINIKTFCTIVRRLLN